MTITIHHVGDRIVSVERAGLLYRYTITQNNRVLRFGCAFTMWGVRYAARHA